MNYNILRAYDKHYNFAGTTERNFSENSKNERESESIQPLSHPTKMLREHYHHHPPIFRLVGPGIPNRLKM